MRLFDDCPWGAEQMVLGYTTSRLNQPFARKQKNTNDTSASPPYHLILLLSNLISILCFSGYGAVMQIVKTQI